jgi:hypothetical protein
MDATTYYPLALTASCSALLISIAALLYVRRQIRTVIRNREADLLLKLYQVSTTTPMESALRTAWALRGAMPCEEDRPACEQVCVFFELVGSLVISEYTGTELIERFFGSLVTGSYDSLRGYIAHMRVTPYNQNFALNFERLRDRIARGLEVSHAPGALRRGLNTPPGRGASIDYVRNANMHTAAANTKPNPRMKTDAQQRCCAPLSRAAYAQRYAF